MIVVGGGWNGTVENNQITNNDHYGFAGLHVGWFPSGNGDHAGMTYQNNTISSAPNKLAFGIIVGFEPWWGLPGNDGLVTNAGSVVSNSVSGAVVNLAIDGIGNGYIQNNSLSNNQGSDGYACSYSSQYTAHYFGGASIQGGWEPRWFFNGQCGSWNTGVPQPGDPGSLVHERKLNPGETKSSGNGQYHLKYQTDGNLVLYDASWTPLWWIDLYPTPDYAQMQADGNFVTYSPGHVAYWNTGTWGNEGAYLVVQDDGNLVVYNISSVPLWCRSGC